MNIVWILLVAGVLLVTQSAFFALTSPGGGNSPTAFMNSVICIFEKPKNTMPISIVSAAKSIE